MDSEVAPLDTRLDGSFLVVSAVLQTFFISRMVYSCCRHRQYVWNAAHEVIKAIGQAFRQQLHADNRKFVLQEVYEIRRYLARAYFRYLLMIFSLVLFVVQWRVFHKHDRYSSAATVWTWTVVFGACGVVEMFPSVISTPNLNAVYLIVSFCWTAHMSPWHVQADRTVDNSLFILILFRLPAVCIATTPALVAGCSVLHVLVILLRASTEVLPPATIFAEISGLIAMVCASASVQLYLIRRVERRLKYKKMATDFNAASSLLHLTCDSMIELDAEFRISEHSPGLAAMMLRGTSSTLAGRDFADLLAGAAEAGRVVELLRRFEDLPADRVHAQAFHTHLMDGDSNRFRTEVFQVRYHTPQGHARHLLGLRDVTDQESLSILGSKNVESFSVVPRSVTPMSAGACSSLGTQSKSPHSSSPNRGTATVEVVADEKYLSLLIDMDLQVIHASSQPDFLGKRPADFFPTAEIELLERYMAEVRKGNFALSFSTLEIHLGSQVQLPELLTVNGTIQVVQASGARYFLMVCEIPLVSFTASGGRISGDTNDSDYVSVTF